MANPTYTLEDLLYLMQRLRKPGTGCPWDLKQTYMSITPSTIEEAYEVVDAIERADYEHLREELGDLLFQVIFYAQLADEERRFDFASIVHQLTDKLLRRHPHVFPEGLLQSEIDPASPVDEKSIHAKWESMKQSERQNKGRHGILDDVPLALPALQRAQKMQKRVAKAGMDWREAHEVLTKLEEEINELREAMRGDSLEAVKEEFGDLLFSCVNLARHLHLDADQCLRSANNKFQRRIDMMSRLLEEAGKQLSDLSADEQNAYWNRVKN